MNYLSILNSSDDLHHCSFSKLEWPKSLRKWPSKAILDHINLD